MTYINEYTIQTIGSKWNKDKEKKNQILTEIKSDNGIHIKKSHSSIGRLTIL